MAIDTRDKRASALHLASPWRGLWPLPDGALNAGDRAQTALFYRGIPASTPAVLTPRLVLIAQPRSYVITAQRRVYVLTAEHKAGSSREL